MNNLHVNNIVKVLQYYFAQIRFQILKNRFQQIFELLKIYSDRNRLH